MFPAPSHVLITGTSGAIGAALARRFRDAWPAARLTLVDRAPGPSEALASGLGDARAVAADLGDVAALPGLIGDAVAASGPIDGLVNCAGFMEVRRFETLDWDRAHALLNVDLVSPLRLMHLVVGDMLQRGRGFVVNVSSMAGRTPLKGCAFYGAAKAGLAMASEITARELAGRGVHVVTVYPGPVASGLEQSARAQYQTGWIARLLPTGQPDVIAARIHDAIARRRRRVIYPSLYGVGYHALPLAAPFTLGAGPQPMV